MYIYIYKLDHIGSLSTRLGYQEFPGSATSATIAGCPSSDRVARGKTPKGCWRTAFTWRNLGVSMASDGEHMIPGLVNHRKTIGKWWFNGI